MLASLPPFPLHPPLQLGNHLAQSLIPGKWVPFQTGSANILPVTASAGAFARSTESTGGLVHYNYGLSRSIEDYWLSTTMID